MSAALVAFCVIVLALTVTGGRAIYSALMAISAEVERDRCDCHNDCRCGPDPQADPIHPLDRHGFRHTSSEHGSTEQPETDDGGTNTDDELPTGERPSKTQPEKAEAVTHEREGFGQLGDGVPLVHHAADATSPETEAAG